MEQDAICAFDTLYTNQNIQMLKLAMPLLAPAYQTLLAVYIRFLEFRYTLLLSEKKQKNTRKQISSPTLTIDSIEKYLDSILPLMSEDDRKRASHLKETIQSMEQFKQLAPIIEMLMKQNKQEEKDSPSSIFDILNGMLSEEQQAMFEMFQKSL